MIAAPLIYSYNIKRGAASCPYLKKRRELQSSHSYNKNNKKRLLFLRSKERTKVLSCPFLFKDLRSCALAQGSSRFAREFNPLIRKKGSCALEQESSRFAREFHPLIIKKSLALWRKDPLASLENFILL